VKSLLARLIPVLAFLGVTLVSFTLLSAAGRGFPVLNPRPGQLIVSSDSDPEDRFPEMVCLSGGAFPMGDPTGRAHASLPVREVVLSDFCISRFEITFSQYDRYCRAENVSLPPDGGAGRSGRPAGNVSWFDAVGYCNWLSEIEGLEPCYSIKEASPAGLPRVICNYSAHGYRLPTEAEWEFAARGGTLGSGFTYAGSHQVDEVAWYFDNAGRYPHQQGLKKPNELGLFDMSGNAYEWTNNRLTGDYSDLPEGTVNPAGPQEEGIRAIRGGSCFFDSWGCQVWYRKSLRPECRLPYVGFRVVRRMHE